MRNMLLTIAIVISACLANASVPACGLKTAKLSNRNFDLAGTLSISTKIAPQGNCVDLGSVQSESQCANKATQQQGDCWQTTIHTEVESSIDIVSLEDNYSSKSEIQCYACQK